MKQLLILLLLAAFSSLTQAQFTDTATLNQYLRDTIRDRRPEKVTAAQLQKGMLGVSDIIHKYNFSNSSSANSTGAAIVHNNRGQTLTFDSVSNFQLNLAGADENLASTLLFNDFGLIHYSPNYNFVMGQTLNLTNKNGFYMTVNKEAAEGEEEPADPNFSFNDGFHLSNLNGFTVSQVDGPSMTLVPSVFSIANAPTVVFNGPENSYSYEMGPIMTMTNPNGFNLIIENGPQMNFNGILEVTDVGSFNLTTNDEANLLFSSNSLAFYGADYDYTMGQFMAINNQGGFSVNIADGPSMNFTSNFTVDGLNMFQFTTQEGASLLLSPSSMLALENLSGFNLGLTDGSTIDFGPNSFNLSGPDFSVFMGPFMSVTNQYGFEMGIPGAATMNLTTGLYVSGLNGFSFNMTDGSMFAFSSNTLSMSGVNVASLSGPDQNFSLVNDAGMFYYNDLSASWFQTKTAIVDLNTESSTRTVSRLFMNSDSTKLMHGIRGIRLSDSSLVFLDSINRATLDEDGFRLVLNHPTAAQFKVSGTNAADYLMLDSASLVVGVPFTSTSGMTVKSRVVSGTSTTIGKSDHIVAIDPAAGSAVTITFTDPASMADGRVIKVCNYSAHNAPVSATAGWVKNIDNTDLTTINANMVYDLAIIGGIWRVTGISSL